MNANDYQKAALRTANPKCKSLINCALGLTGEAGEFADMIKKHEFHGHELDRDAAIKELGDVLWYAAVAADVLGVSLGEVMRRNVEKLMQRYPNGFSTEDSVKRVDVNGAAPKAELVVDGKRVGEIDGLDENTIERIMGIIDAYHDYKDRKAEC